MRELLKELHRMGKTIIVSSHILHELAELCSTVGIIERGELLYHGPIEEIIRRTRSETLVEIKVPARIEQGAAARQKLEAASKVETEDGRLRVSLKSETRDFSFLARTLLEAKVPIQEIREEQVNLETAFMRFTKGIVQ